MKKPRKKGKPKRQPRDPPSGGGDGNDPQGWFGMAAFARAMKNPHVTAISVVGVVALGSAVLGASDVVVVIVSLAVLAAVLISQRIAHRNIEKVQELRIDHTIKQRVEENNILIGRSIEPETEKEIPALPPVGANKDS